MHNLVGLDRQQPPTLESVLEAVERLARLDMAGIQAAASAGKLEEKFGFAVDAALPADAVERDPKRIASPFSSRRQKELAEAAADSKSAGVEMSEASRTIIDQAVSEVHALVLAKEFDADKVRTIMGDTFGRLRNAEPSTEAIEALFFVSAASNSQSRLPKLAVKMPRHSSAQEALEKELEQLYVEQRGAKASLRGVRLSAQHGRLVADQIRSMTIEKARNILAFSPKKGATIIKKVLESAIANAEHNDGIDIDELKIKTIYVEKGMVLKRFAARAKGRGNRISKQTSHVYVKIGDGKK